MLSNFKELSLTDVIMEHYCINILHITPAAFGFGSSFAGGAAAGLLAAGAAFGAAAAPPPPPPVALISAFSKYSLT